MPKPLLHRPQINARPQTPRCKGRAKLVQPELFLVELGSFRASLQAVEEIQLRIAAGSRTLAPNPSISGVSGYVFSELVRRQRTMLAITNVTIKDGEL